MTRPFEGIRIIDITHVLAGPFAAYQLAVLGAEVIKVEDPNDPDQTRGTGTDRALNRRQMGTGFLTQASNKRAITLDLKSETGCNILKRLVGQADVMVENYRPGAFEALGLGYEVMAALNPRLIYCSISAFGQDGPRRNQTAYDHVIQATSGLMATTGTEAVNPIKFGVAGGRLRDRHDGCFRARQRIVPARAHRKRPAHRSGDARCRDDPDELASDRVSAQRRRAQAVGEPNPHATNSSYQTKDGLVSLGASNLRQQRRLWLALERPDMVKDDNEARDADREREAQLLAEILKTRTADEWEAFFQARHVPAARVRRLSESVRDPQFATRGVTHRHDGAPGVEGGFSVPLAAFKFAHGGPSIETPPPEFGADTDKVLAEYGYAPAEIAAFRRDRVI